jgi:superfamily II DNA/RNA helicase
MAALPGKPGTQKRVQYWTALALLRGVMSSPAAGIEMLNTRLSNLPSVAGDDTAIATASDAASTANNPVRDTEFGFECDNAPTQVIERHDWTSQQRQQLRHFAQQLERLSTVKEDHKLASAALILEDWLTSGCHPVVFCRYIATANYVGEHLAPVLKQKFSRLDLQVVTSELPDDVRKQRIGEMGQAPLRVLIATDCLSEGINLQEHFTGVLHYDLPWNPNRLEQREGRVDRFG